MLARQRSILVLIVGLGVTTAVLSPIQALASCLTLHGNLIQGGLIWTTGPLGSRVSLDGESLDVLEDGTIIAGFGRDAPATAELVVEDGADVCRQTLQIAPREYAVQRVQGVPQKTVTPPPEQLARIRQERALVNAAKAEATVAARPATQRFSRVSMAYSGANIRRVRQSALLQWRARKPPLRC